MLGLRQHLRMQAALQSAGGNLEKRRYHGLVANRTLENEGSMIAWFYAEGIDGSVSKLPVQVTAAEPGTIVYVDDTGGLRCWRFPRHVVPLGG